MAGATEQLNPAVPQPGGTSVANTMQPLEAPTWPPEYAARALEAAPAKLAAVMEEAPIARFSHTATTRTLMKLVAHAFNAALLLAFAFVWESHGVFALLGWLHLLWGLKVGVGLARRSLARPSGVVRAAFAAGMTNDFACLDELRITSDRNAALRLLPGHPQGVALPLSTPAQLKVYWLEIRRRFQAPCGVTLLTAKSSMVDQRVCLVSVRLLVNSIRLPAVFVTLGLMCLSAIAILALDEFLGPQGRPLLPWLTLSFAAGAILGPQLYTAGRVVTLRKLVVKCGTQWRLFSGELQAPEEADLSWLAQQNN